MHFKVAKIVFWDPFVIVIIPPYYCKMVELLRMPEMVRLRTESQNKDHFTIVVMGHNYYSKGDS